MKRIILILYGILFSMSAFCQTSYVYNEVLPINIKSTIIKEVKYPATLTCVNSIDEGVLFIYADASLNTRELAVEVEGLEVYDMAVENHDTVFFCGQVKRNGVSKGVIGYFLIPDLLSGSSSMNIFLQQHFVSGQNSRLVERLTKLVTYNSTNGDRHIVCIGRCIGNDNDYYPCIVDMSGTLFISMGYNSGYHPNNKETFEDIKIVTKNYTDEPYIITAGFNVLFGRYIGFRVYEPDNVLTSSSGIEDTLHFLNIDSTGIRRWYDDGLSLSNVKRGYFATMSFRNNLQSNNNDINANIHLGIYSLADVLGGSSGIMSEGYEIPYLNTTNRRMKDFIYCPTYKYMVFLHEATNLLFIASASYYCEIQESALSNTGVLDYFNNPDVELHRLWRYNGRKECIMSGKFREEPFRVEYGMDTYGIVDRCADYYSYSYSQTGNLSTSKLYREFNENYGIDLSKPIRCEILDFSIREVCPSINNN